MDMLVSDTFLDSTAGVKHAAIGLSSKEVHTMTRLHKFGYKHVNSKCENLICCYEFVYKISSYYITGSLSDWTLSR